MTTTPTSPKPVAWARLDHDGSIIELVDSNVVAGIWRQASAPVQPLYAAAPAPPVPEWHYDYLRHEIEQHGGIIDPEDGSVTWAPVPEVELETTPEGRRSVAAYLNQHLPRGFQFEDRIRAIADAMFRDIASLQAALAGAKRAVEFAEYMATAAERYANIEGDTTTPDELNEAYRKLRSCIYEFRKRALIHAKQYQAEQRGAASAPSEAEAIVRLAQMLAVIPPETSNETP